MLRRILRHVRNQPKETRSRYAFGLASVFTFAVGLVWFVNQAQLPARVGEGAQIEYTPFSSLVNQTKDQLAAARAALEGATTTEREGGSGENEGTGSTTVLNMVLTPETIAQVQAESPVATTTSSEPLPQPVPVQIVTTSTRSVSTSTLLE